jgi:hypothetical protein
VDTLAKSANFHIEKAFGTWQLGITAKAEFPGCPTRQESLANAEIAIQEWIETARELGRPIPEPRGRLSFA